MSDLLREIERYLLETHTTPTAFTMVTATEPRLIKDMRRGRQVGAVLALRLREAMNAHPDGMTTPRLRDKPVQSLVGQRSPGEHVGKVPEHRRVERFPCPRCGVRSDIGCEHTASRLYAGIASL